MNRPPEGKLHDHLIREALKQDIEMIDPPPSDHVWQRLEKSLLEHKRPKAKLYFGWSRYAVYAAAACLLIIVGGIVIIRLAIPETSTIVADGPLRTLSESLVLDSEPDEPADLEAAFTEPAVDEAFEADTVMEEPEVEEELPVESATEAPLEAAVEDTGNGEPLAEELSPENEVTLFASPPGDEDIASGSLRWPEEIAGGFILNDTVGLEMDENIIYQGAYYDSKDANLLWVKSTVEDESLDHFLDRLGNYLQDDLEVEERTRESVYFVVADINGLAWQADSQNQALVVLSGEVLPDMLHRIILQENRE